jgi:cell division protein FtsL
MSAMNITGMITPVGPHGTDGRAGVRRASPVAGITPEFYFHKNIDNSRLVKVVDPRRRREIRMFSGSVAALFLLIMFYSWQHFSAIEYGYKIEAQKAERDRLVEVNRSLQLEEAGLRDPGRIDVLARQMGLEAPEPGQVQRLDTDTPAVANGSPVMARMSPVAVIPAQ